MTCAELWVVLDTSPKPVSFELGHLTGHWLSGVGESVSLCKVGAVSVFVCVVGGGGWLCGVGDGV